MAKLFDLTHQALNFVRENDFPTIFQAVKSKDAHPIIQFLKYGVCGGIATVASMGTWFVLARTVYPAIDGMMVDGAVISDNLRATNSTIANVWGWVFGNAVAYVTNLAFVFEGGRHSRWVEFLSFTAVSFLAFIVGLLAGPYLIKEFGLNTYISQLTFLFASLAMNFVCRKFFIFKS